MEAAVLCELKTTKCSHRHREIDSGRNKIQQSKHACIAEAHESTSKDHEDHLAEKGFNSLCHYNLVHKFIPVRQAMNIRDAKAAVDKERESLMNE